MLGNRLVHMRRLNNLNWFLNQLPRLDKHRRLAAILGQRLARQQNYLCCGLLKFFLNIDLVRLGGMLRACNGLFTRSRRLSIFVIRNSAPAASAPPP